MAESNNKIDVDVVLVSYLVPLTRPKIAWPCETRPRLGLYFRAEEKGTPHHPLTVCCVLEIEEEEDKGGKNELRQDTST